MNFCSVHKINKRWHSIDFISGRHTLQWALAVPHHINAARGGLVLTVLTLQMSTSTFKNTTAGYFLLNLTNAGAIVLHGPHLTKRIMQQHQHISNNDK